MQRDAEYTLRYLEARLDEISGVFTDKKADMHLTTPESVFDMSKDIWRVAKANVCLALGNYAEAMSCLQQIADSGRYALDSGNEYEPGDGTIMHLIVADEVMQGHSIVIIVMLTYCLHSPNAISSQATMQKHRC